MISTLNTIAIIAASAIIGLAVCVAIYKWKNNARADLSQRSND